MVSLGLGIAANVLIFTGANRLLLLAPPLGHPETLLEVRATFNHGRQIGGLSASMYDDLQEHLQSFTGVAAYNDFLPAAMGGPGEPVRLWGQSATTNFFEIAQLPMKLGRGFHSGEERAPVVVLGYGLWRRHFSGDTTIIGKPVLLSGRTFTVVGVMMPGFHGMNRLLNVEFWVPDGEWEQLAGDAMNGHTAHELGLRTIIARLKPGSRQMQAQVELDAMARQFAVAYPKDGEGLGFSIQQAGVLSPDQRTGFAIFLLALSVVALMVLCIASSNVANLLLARAAARHREMAVCIALGATRFQLIRPMMIESTLLALCGGGFGVVLGAVGLRGLAVFDLPVPIPIDLTLSMDWRVMSCAFLLSVGTGVLCGIGPAIAASRPVIQSSLKGESALMRPGRWGTLRNMLVVLQIALSTVLLCITGLFLRSLDKSARVDPGIRTTGVLMMSIDPVHNGYTPKQTVLLLKRLRLTATGPAKCEIGLLDRQGAALDLWSEA
jgi:predicted permease